MIFVDTNILIDVASGNPEWANWSSQALAAARKRGLLLFNAAVHAEFAIGFSVALECEAEIGRFDLTFVEITKAAAFCAAQAFRQYKRAGGSRTNVLPDFLIGARADAVNIPLLTRDARRYRTYFPDLELITPETK